MKLFTGAKWGGTGISRLTSGVKNLDTFLGSDRANEHIQMERNYGGDAGHWAENRQGGYGRGDSWVFNVHLGAGGQVLVLREISDRGDGSRHGEGGGRKRRAAQCFNSCSAQPQNDSEGKKKLFYLFAFSFHISCQQHSSISVISQEA